MDAMDARLGATTTTTTTLLLLVLLAAACCLEPAKAQDGLPPKDIPPVEIRGIWKGYAMPTEKSLFPGPMCGNIIIRAPGIASILAGVLKDEDGVENCNDPSLLDFEAATYSRQTHFFVRGESSTCNGGEMRIFRRHLSGPVWEPGKTTGDCIIMKRADDKDGPVLLVVSGFPKTNEGDSFPDVVCPKDINDRDPDRVDFFSSIRPVNQDDVVTDPKDFTCK